jgi:hypothetical protein
MVSRTVATLSELRKLVGRLRVELFVTLLLSVIDVIVQWTTEPQARADYSEQGYPYYVKHNLRGDGDAVDPFYQKLKPLRKDFHQIPKLNYSLTEI